MSHQRSASLPPRFYAEAIFAASFGRRFRPPLPEMQPQLIDVPLAFVFDLRAILALVWETMGIGKEVRERSSRFLVIPKKSDDSRCPHLRPSPPPTACCTRNNVEREHGDTEGKRGKMMSDQSEKMRGFAEKSGLEHEIREHPWK